MLQIYRSRGNQKLDSAALGKLTPCEHVGYVYYLYLGKDIKNPWWMLYNLLHVKPWIALCVCCLFMRVKIIV